MATCSVQSLATDAACFAAETSGQLDALQAVLLCRILQALDPVAECNVQDLMNDAACFAALPLGMLKVIQVQLLCEINTNISAALPLSGNGSPEGVVTGAVVGQTYVDIDPTSPTYQSEFRFFGTPGTNTGWI